MRIQKVFNHIVILLCTGGKFFQTNRHGNQTSFLWSPWYWNWNCQWFFFIALVENGSRRYLPQRICFKALTFWTPYYNLLCCCWEMAKAIVSLVPFSKWVSYWPYVFRWVFWGNQHTKLLDRNEWLANWLKSMSNGHTWTQNHLG